MHLKCSLATESRGAVGGLLRCRQDVHEKAQHTYMYLLRDTPCRQRRLLDIVSGHVCMCLILLSHLDLFEPRQTGHDV